MDNLLELYCVVDEFCKEFMPKFEKNQLEIGIKQRNKPCRLSSSEIMTIIIYFHQMQFRNFKTYYIQYIQKHLIAEFPQLVSYSRFVELMPLVLLPLCFFVHCQHKTNKGLHLKINIQNAA